MTEPTNGGSGAVTFTVKELLARQDVKLDTIILELRTKADRDDLKSLEGRVDSLERSRDTQDGSSTLTRWIVPVLVSILAVAVPAAIAILSR